MQSNITVPIPVAVRSKAWVCGRSLTGIVGSNPTPIPVAVRSKAWVCGRLIVGTAGTNPAEDMVFHLLCLLCVVQVAASATS